MALSLVFVMAFMLAPAALAEEPVQDPNCSFEKGKTTCVTTKETSYFTTQQFDSVQRFCPGSGYKLVPLLHNYQTDVTETTTTVYRGKSNQVESTETTTSEVGPYPVGPYYAGSC